MSDSSILTLSVTRETRAKLDHLARRTQRTQQEVVDEVLAEHLDRELATVEAIETGRAEIRAGQGLSTEEVFRTVYKSIAETEERWSNR